MCFQPPTIEVGISQNQAMPHQAYQLAQLALKIEQIHKKGQEAAKIPQIEQSCVAR